MTRASDLRPTRRTVTSTYDGDLVIEVTERLVTIRPKGSRKDGPAQVQLPWGLVYQLGLSRRVTKTKKSRRITRGQIV